MSGISSNAPSFVTFNPGAIPVGFILRNYDWPDEGTENPYAALPFLSWQAGTAAEVVRSLVKEYETTMEGMNGRLLLYLGATTFLNGKTVIWDNCQTSLDRGGKADFDFVILALGFGIERWVRRGSAQSYWRNDDLNQLRPGVTSEKGDVFFVSGTGDGGLIDLLRCKIKGFNQAWIIDDLFSSEYGVLLITVDGDDDDEVPKYGRNRLIVAKSNGEVKFRLFDGNGKRVYDSDEETRPNQANLIKKLEANLKNLWPPHRITMREKHSVISQVTSFLGYNLPDPKYSDQLVTHLRDIRMSSKSVKASSDNQPLFGRFKTLKTNNNQLIDWVLDKLRPMIRTDIAVVLNGSSQTFSDVLSLRSASMLNCFLAFLLYEEKAFTYVPGELRNHEPGEVTVVYPPRREYAPGGKLASQSTPAFQNSKPPIEQGIATQNRESSEDGAESTYLVDRVIVRHGTEKDKVLSYLGLEKDDIQRLQKNQNGTALDESPIRQWRAGWWSRDPRNNDEKQSGEKEFLPPASEAIAATFTRTLSQVLMKTKKPAKTQTEKKEFRLTVHRALKIRHKLYFQQMAPYGGSGSRVGGESGRIFPIETGVVGLAFRTGRPVVLTKKKQTTWKEIWRELRSGPNTNVQTPSRHVNSLLAMPILCPTATNEKGEVHDCVSLVVYADSQTQNSSGRGTAQTVRARKF